MAQESDAPESRLSGDAAWKADRDATERRNSEAKRRASEHTTASASAAMERERRLAAAESAQLQVLNARIVARAAGRSPGLGGGTAAGD
jgi:3-mercaptopyruvate sulfurtransferase SseA